MVERVNDDEAPQVKVILAHLDTASAAGEYPYPQHERMDYAAMRLHAYRGATAADHVLLFEMLMFDREARRILRFHGFCNHVFLYGSRGGARGQMVWEDAILPCPIENEPDGAPLSMTEQIEEFTGPMNERVRVNPRARAVMVRGERVPLSFDAAVYRAHGIEPSEPLALRDLLRLLVATHRDALFSSIEERAALVDGMKEVLTLDAFHHLDLDEHTAPSETEAMRMVAEVLATGDPKRYEPTEAPNTDWRVVAELT